MTKLTADKDSNIDLVIKASKACFDKYPILKDLTTVQAILESDLEEKEPKHKGKGGSQLAIQYCNLFGIKPGSIVHTGTAGIVTLMTTEYINGVPERVPARFLSNNNIEDSFVQHEQLLSSLDRYSNLFEAKTFEEAAHLIQQDGYATDPGYPNELIQTYYYYLKDSDDAAS